MNKLNHIYSIHKIELKDGIRSSKVYLDQAAKKRVQTLMNQAAKTARLDELEQICNASKDSPISTKDIQYRIKELEKES